MFVTDANDEPPEFQNLPFVVDVPEVHYIFIMSYTAHITKKYSSCHLQFLNFFTAVCLFS